jgi:hypothetical protein
VDLLPSSPRTRLTPGRSWRSSGRTRGAGEGKAQVLHLQQG